MSMTHVNPQATRHGLHLSIDPSYDLWQTSVTPESRSPSSSPPLSNLTSGTTPTSEGSELISLHVLCMHDFESQDLDHLSFKKNQILEVVKQEESGWWAAVNLDGTRGGWVPKAFVQPLTPDMTEKLRSVREELRVFEYAAEKLYNTAPIARPLHLYDSEPSPRSPKDKDFPIGDSTGPVTPTRYRSEGAFPLSSHQETSGQGSPRPRPSPSPLTPMPQPPLGATLLINRTFPSTPYSQWNDASGMRGNLQRSRTTLVPGPSDMLKTKNTSDKILKLTGSPDALAFHQAKQGFSTQPWYLRPNFTPDQLVLDNDLNAKAGTLNALVEILITDPPSIAQETSYRNTFLMTFRTFTTPDVVFDMLTSLYRMDPPAGVNAAEIREWREKRLSVVQKRVLTVLTMWLEDHNLLEEEPHIAQRLTDFLVTIVDPAPLALTAKLMLKSLERLTFASPHTPTPNISPRRRRRNRPHKNDLLKLDPTDIAEQLCQLEHAMYAKVRPQQCLNWPITQVEKSVEHLRTFCATHDKLASWVKTSILENEAIGRRADVIDLWIKVAEKCRNLNNFASMSAIINALSSTAVSQLHLTWAHVGRKSTLDALLRHNEPTGSFSGYRALLQSVDGPCVPFIGMFLIELVHIHDKYSDAMSPTTDKPLICFFKRQRWYNVVTAMLKYQQKPYNFPDSDSTRTFIESNLHTASLKDPSWFWSKSQDVQHSELAHADIRRGLVEAGF